MADQFGALPLPVPVPAARDDLVPPIPAARTSLGDPCLDTLLSYIAAVLEYLLTSAWATRAPGSQINRAARFLSTNDPREGNLSDNQVPGLFLFRSKGQTSSKYAADLPSTEEVLILDWVLPADAQFKDKARGNIINAITKALVLAIEHGVHPAWVVAADLAQPTAVRLDAATPVAPTVYSDADLDGAIGGGTVYAARPVTVTTAPRAVPTYNTTDPIVVTGTLPTGQGWTDTLYLTDPLGGETVATGWNFASAQSVAAPAQLLASGSWSFGFADSPEKPYGSPVRRYAGLLYSRCGVGERTTLKVTRGSGRDAASTLEYQMFEFEIYVHEIYRVDQSVLPTWADAAEGIGIRIQETVAGTPEIYQTADLDA